MYVCMYELIPWIKWSPYVHISRFNDRENRIWFLLLTNASKSLRSCSRICSYVVSSAFPLCSFAFRKAFASFDCRPLNSISSSENSSTSDGAVVFFVVSGFLVVFTVGVAVCFDAVFGSFVFEVLFNSLCDCSFAIDGFSPSVPGFGTAQCTRQFRTSRATESRITSHNIEKEK